MNNHNRVEVTISSKYSRAVIKKRRYFNSGKGMAHRTLACFLINKKFE